MDHVAPGAFLHPFSRPAKTDFITIVRGEGAVVWDDAGHRYVDGLASLWYCQVGHGRSAIADAVHRQMRVLEDFHTFEMFTNEPAEALTAALADRAPMPGARVFLTNSGSEAVDTALKLARLTFTRRGEPERHLILSRRHAYHGVTYGGMSVQGLPLNREGYGPLLPGIHSVAHDELDDAEGLFAERGDEIAAVIAEPVIGAGGVRPPPAGYLEGLRTLCDRHGALFILDEVITGFGRLGSWWGAERYGVTPDLVVFAKGVTSGYLPLGGVLVGRPVLDVLEADPDFVLRHGFTYSGHPTSCSAALANLQILEDEDLPARALHIGDVLGPALGHLVGDGLASESRGLAGIWAVDLPIGVDAAEVRMGLLEHGVIARPIGASTIALCPPLVISDDDLDRCVTALRHVVEVA